MGCFIEANPTNKNRFRRCPALGIIPEERFQEPQRALKIFVIEKNFPFSQEKSRNQLLRRHEARNTMMFLPFLIEENQVRCFFDLEPPCQRLVIVGQAQGDHIFMNRRNHLRIRKRNRFHLPAARSTRVEEIHEKGPALCLCFPEGLVKVALPLNPIFRHSDFPRRPGIRRFS